MKYFFKFFDHLLLFLNIFFLSFIVILTLLQVADRYYFKIGFRGLQEITILLFTWGIFMGAALAVKNKEHFKIDIWPAKFITLNKILDIFSQLVILIIAFIFLIQGYNLTISSLTRFSRQLGISRAWSVAVIPASGLVMIIYLIKDFINNFIFKGKGNLEEEKQ